MKVDKQIRDAFSDQHATNSALKTEADRVATMLDPGWHYESRLKSEESFALKVEAGLFSGNLLLDDFLGCLIVVRSNAEISKAIDVVRQHFSVQSRRPPDDTHTKLRPTDFSFDDLRLYVTIKPADYLPKPQYSDVIFEIQIKTFLQHAWGIATHDLTYKTDAISWAKARVAHQVRAMLEHAELTIEQVDSLTESSIVAKENDEYASISKMIDLLKELWRKERLPRDLVRLARNANTAISVLNIPFEALVRELKAETISGKGANLENLSPYGAIMQTILDKFPQRIVDFRPRPRTRQVPISSQVEVPAHLAPLKAPFVII